MEWTISPLWWLVQCMQAICEVFINNKMSNLADQPQAPKLQCSHFFAGSLGSSCRVTLVCSHGTGRFLLDTSSKESTFSIRGNQVLLGLTTTCCPFLLLLPGLDSMMLITSTKPSIRTEVLMTCLHLSKELRPAPSLQFGQHSAWGHMLPCFKQWRKSGNLTRFSCTQIHF